MACKCAPALITARNELNAIFPNRDKSSDGCCGDAAHAVRKSDHNPLNGYARAYDYDEDIVSGMGDRELTGMGLVLLSDPRTKYLIYERQLLYPDGTVKPYSGINAHEHHLHHSIKDSAVHDTKPWGIARAFQHQEDDDMFEDKDRALLGKIVAALIPEDDISSTGEVTKRLRSIDVRTAAASDPAAFAAQVAQHLDGITADAIEVAVRAVFADAADG